MATHPFTLDVIQIASPCQVPWETMSGDDRVRHCAQCQKPVYNLSEMTRDEAEKLVLEKAGSLCGRFYRRADGTILTADCPVGWWDVRSRFMRLWAGIAALASFLTFGAFCVGHQAVEPNPDPQIDGPAESLKNSLADPGMFAWGDVCIPVPVAPNAPPPASVQQPKGEE